MAILRGKRSLDGWAPTYSIFSISSNRHAPSLLIKGQSGSKESQHLCLVVTRIFERQRLGAEAYDDGHVGRPLSYGATLYSTLVLGVSAVTVSYIALMLESQTGCSSELIHDVTLTGVHFDLSVIQHKYIHSLAKHGSPDLMYMSVSSSGEGWVDGVSER